MSDVDRPRPVHHFVADVDALCAAVMEERDRELLNWITEEFKAPVDSRAEQALTDLVAFMGYEPDGKRGWNKHG